jgi:hypothetical protein
MDRYRRLLGDGEAYEWLNHAYDVRNNYLHSLGNLKDAIVWGDLAHARWSVIKAVDRYLELTEARSGFDREKLLKSLKE